MSCSSPRRSRASSSRAARRSSWPSSSTSATSTPLYYDKPYFVVPADDLAEEAFVVLRDALRAGEEGRHRPAGDARAGICRRLKPCGRGMVLETLRYADEVNKATSYFRDIGDAKPDPDLLDLADDADREEDRRVRRRPNSTTTTSMRCRS